VQKSILVTSPDRAFAELLRSSLEESGRYRVHQAVNAREALAVVEEGGFDLVILDAEIEDEPVAAVGQRLMALDANMLLMVIPPDNDPQHLSLVNFTPHSFLNRPFYMPDFVTRLDALLGMAEREPAAAAVPQLIMKATGDRHLSAWLQDRQQVSTELEMLLRETYFASMLIVDTGKLIGSSLHLDAQDARSLSDRIGQDWDQHSDLARYIRLNERGGEFLLYATLLSGGICLATISDVTLPLSQVRSRTRTLVRTLLTAIAQQATEAEEQRLHDEAVMNRVDEVLAAGNDFRMQGMILPEAESIEEDSDEDADGDLGDGPLINLNDLLAGMPSPDPEVIITPSEWEAAAPDEAPAPAPEPEPVDAHSPAMPVTEEPPHNGVPELVLPWEEEDGSAWAFTTPLSPDPISDTQPAPLLDDRSNGSEATSPVFVQISFTCILIPASTEHRLVGDLAKSLNHWLPQICLGFGWHLQGMRIQAEYMLWIVSVTPTVSPGNVVRMVRNRTSEQIFAQFPDLHEKDMAGDFWSPGYLVISGSQAPTEQLVGDFIRQTRRRQGTYLKN
jgi:DNA-binding response OmpR family regulator/REP element-mobilizing transposase RayT